MSAESGQLEQYLTRLGAFDHEFTDPVEERRYDEAAEYRRAIIQENPDAAERTIRTILTDRSADPDLRLEAINCLVDLSKRDGYFGVSIELCGIALQGDSFQNDARWNLEDIVSDSDYAHRN